MSDIIAEIKTGVKENKLIFGAEETMKALRNGQVDKIYLAANSPINTKEDIMHYAKIAGVEVADTQTRNDDLGNICKKPFAIAVIGRKK